jgi:hypothetical protein
MFDPIHGPPDHYSGPSVGLSTEKGDSWHTAVAKINAGFHKIVEAIEGGVQHDVEAADTEARSRITALEETVAAMQIRLDAITAPPALDPDGQPATGGVPVAADPSDPKTDTL